MRIAVGRACIVMLVALGAMSPATVAKAEPRTAFIVHDSSTPVLDTPPSDHDEEDSVGFMVGRVIGTLMFGGIIALVLWSSNRRKAEQRAHEARFALPPPTFGSAPPRATLPPPSLPAPQPSPSMSDH